MSNAFRLMRRKIHGEHGTRSGRAGAFASHVHKPMRGSGLHSWHGECSMGERRDGRGIDQELRFEWAQ